MVQQQPQFRPALALGTVDVGQAFGAGRGHVRVLFGTIVKTIPEEVLSLFGAVGVFEMCIAGID